MRDELVKRLNYYLGHIYDLEQKREEFAEPSYGYRNLSGSIFHYEGRVEQLRDVLQIMDGGVNA